MTSGTASDTRDTKTGRIAAGSSRGVAVVRWFDTWASADAAPKRAEPGAPRRVEWVRVLPFVFLHVACFGALWTGWSPVAVWTAAVLYFVRMFAITGFYHRYFSHRTFSTSRAAQFAFALLGASAVQRGALWWASHHRVHHRVSDQPEDVHSPRVHGFLWSHIGWITSRENFHTDVSQVKDLAKYPELVFLDRFDMLVPVLYAGACFAAGAVLERLAPGLGTDAWQMLVWGFFISTVVLFHATSTINSLSHLFGSRRYETTDDSRNNALLAVITLGEGWHNNHHHFQGSVRQGFRWYEYDITYYILRCLALTGLIWDLHPVPEEVLNSGKDRAA